MSESRVVTAEEAAEFGFCPKHLWDVPCPDCKDEEQMAWLEAHADA